MKEEGNKKRPHPKKSIHRKRASKGFKASKSHTIKLNKLQAKQFSSGTPSNTDIPVAEDRAKHSSVGREKDR